MKPTTCPSCGVETLTLQIESGRTVIVNREPHLNGNVWIGGDNIGRIMAKEPPEFAHQMVKTDLYLGHGVSCSAAKRKAAYRAQFQKGNR